MGEQADFLLNGDDCAGCGVPFRNAGIGIPRYCAGCEPRGDSAGISKPYVCPVCARRFASEFALGRHRQAKEH
jgi:hypothetical protein